MQLVIVESFAKAKTIQNYLNKGSEHKFKVVASGGHLFDLAKSGGKSYGLRDTLQFEPIYELISDKAATFKKLKAEVKQAALVWLAADNDREGEAIAWHLQRALPSSTYRRIVFNEITPGAIRSAMEAPRQIDNSMVEAQQTRRVLDRVIGYSLSQVLSKGFAASGRPLSAGRVQSVVLRLIVEKEREVRAHTSTRYWTVEATFTQGLEEALLYKNETMHKFSEERLLGDFFASLGKNDRYRVQTGAPSRVREGPEAPFTTSTLQQRATSLGLSIQRTMALAQALYEQGHITYMRTDSTALSKEAIEGVRSYVTDTWGSEYLKERESGARKAPKHAQGAHEAIRPTRPRARTPTAIKEPDALKLYHLIFDHTAASQMAHAVYCELKIRVQNDALPKDMLFLCKTKALQFPGWRAALGTPQDTKGLESINAFVSSESARTEVRCRKMRASCVWTVPPARYSEASMIKKMEKEGIGRPSTYVSMVQKLYERHYVQKSDLKGDTKTYTHYLFSPKTGVKAQKESRAYYSESGRLLPTSAGSQVSEFVVRWFSELVNVEFTSGMEEKLDQIAASRTSYRRVMREFYPSFADKCEKVLAKVSRKDLDDGSRRAMKHGRVVRMGRYGALLETPCSDGKPKFVGLEPYMKLAKKQLDQINEGDVELLMRMPFQIGQFTVRYGRYGFYASRACAGESRRLTIYGRYLERMLQGNWQFLEEMFRNCPEESKKKISD